MLDGPSIGQEGRMVNLVRRKFFSNHDSVTYLVPDAVDGAKSFAAAAGEALYDVVSRAIFRRS